jgi:hypothetical protein
MLGGGHFAAAIFKGKFYFSPMEQWFFVYD